MDLLSTIYFKRHRSLIRGQSTQEVGFCDGFRSTPPWCDPLWLLLWVRASPWLYAWSKSLIACAWMLSIAWSTLCWVRGSTQGILVVETSQLWFWSSSTSSTESRCSCQVDAQFSIAMATRHWSQTSSRRFHPLQTCSCRTIRQGVRCFMKWTPRWSENLPSLRASRQSCKLCDSTLSCVVTSRKWSHLWSRSRIAFPVISARQSWNLCQFFHQWSWKPMSPSDWLPPL